MIIILSINNVPDDETNSTRRIPENISLSVLLSSIERRNHLFLVSLTLARTKERKENDEDRKEYRMDHEWELVISSLLANLCNGL